MSGRHLVRAAPDRATERSIRNGLRLRLAGRWALWIVTTGAAVTWWGFSADASYQVDRAISDGTTVTATISRIDDSDPDYTETFIEVDGTEFVIEDTPPTWSVEDVRRLISDGPPGYRVGGEVEVVLDPYPSDPELNWAYDISRYGDFSWPGALLGLFFMTGAIGLVRGLLTRHWALPDNARWQLWRVKTSTTVTVVEVRDVTHRFAAVQVLTHVIETVVYLITSTEPLEVHHLVVEADGRRYFWEVRTDVGDAFEIGSTFRVVGRVRRRGWVVGLTHPLAYPLARLD